LQPQKNKSAANIINYRSQQRREVKKEKSIKIVNDSSTNSSVSIIKKINGGIK
jgi:hypothetical protein